MSEEQKTRLTKVLRELRDVVLFPLLSGLAFGIGTASGRRLAEKWYKQDLNKVSATA